MGRLERQYGKYKQKDGSNLYIFSCGMFYVALNDDAKIISNLFKYKLVDAERYEKVSIPKSKCKPVVKYLKNNGYEVRVIDEAINDKILEDIIQTDIMNTTPQEAINKLNGYVELLRWQS